MISKQLAARHFLEKFENTGAGGVEVLSLLQSDGDVLVISKKHSGSLVLLHAVFTGGKWCLVVNSKNGTNNDFSIPAESYFRAQFKALYGDHMDEKFEEFVTFMGTHSLTFSFEFVTTFLGDHGARPNVSYAVVVAISQFNDCTGTSRFLSIPEMVHIAVDYKLILNEIWVVPRENAERVGQDLHSLRWTGWDNDFTNYLDCNASFKVHSILPHSLGQGPLLEGLVVQACRTTTDALLSLQDRSKLLINYQSDLLAGLKEWSLTELPKCSPNPPDTAEAVSDNVAFLQHVLSSSTDNDTPLKGLLKYLLNDLPKEKLRLFSFKSIVRGGNKSFIIHVRQDEVFFYYQKRKPFQASQLFRGMEVFTQRELPSIERNFEKIDAPLFPWEIMGISKWKNWNYIKRTFCMRNPLQTLFTYGHENYLQQVNKQFGNWGLPQELVTENARLMSAWGHWLLSNSAARHDFLTNRRGFSYLRYLEKFQEDFDSNSIDHSVDKPVSVLFIYYFEDVNCADWLAPLMSGYSRVCKLGKSKPKYCAGNVYVLNHSKPPTPAECPYPHFIVAVAPSEECIDRKALGCFQSFSDKYATKEYKYPIFVLSSEKQVPECLNRLHVFNAHFHEQTKVLISMLAMQPGSGKSTFSDMLLDELTRHGHKVVKVSSDFFGMRSSSRKASKVEFENAVVDALRSPDLNIVIYDKNIPNMAGYHCMKSLASRAGLPNIVLMPLVPDTFTEDIAEICLERIMCRLPGSHTLTLETSVEGYASTEEFVRATFTKPCLDFIDVAKSLPQAFTMDGYFYEGDSKRIVKDIACEVDKRLAMSPTSHCNAFDLSCGSYLGLHFQLDDEVATLFQDKLGVDVRRYVHVTVKYFGDDPNRLKEAASIISSLSLVKSSTRECQVTRLGIIRDDLECKTLAWGSCSVEGFNHLPLHITLFAEGFQNSDAYLAELEYDAGSVQIGETNYLIEKIDIDPVQYLATWLVM